MIVLCHGKARSGLALVLLMLFSLVPTGCFYARTSHGGGQARFEPPRRVNPRDVQVPPGYRVEVVSTGLTFPTGITFDDQGRPYVTESGYSYGERWTRARLVRLEPDGTKTIIAESRPTPWNNGPWNGVTFHQGNFYVAEGGERFGGRILRISLEGRVDVLIDGLPSLGDHQTNGPVIGPDGMIYFGQGTATNSGIVGADNLQFGWLGRYPQFHDIPARDVVLTGYNATTHDVLSISHGAVGDAHTGAYSAYGVPTWRGEVIPGQVPCTGAVMRIPLDGSATPEVVAWGLRNPYGLAFTRDGQLYATENSYDVRGSRPVFGTGDLLWNLHDGLWYGWPDYFAGQPLTNRDRFQPPFGAAAHKLLAVDPNRPPLPTAKFPVHASACGIDFSRSEAFGHVDEAFVAEFGDMAPTSGKVLAPVGFSIVRVNVNTGDTEVFAANRGKRIAPASYEHRHGLERPIAVRFDPSGESLYVVDFGVMTIDGKKPNARPNTGVIWRITRTGH